MTNPEPTRGRRIDTPRTSRRPRLMLLNVDAEAVGGFDSGDDVRELLTAVPEADTPQAESRGSAGSAAGHHCAFSPLHDAP